MAAQNEWWHGFYSGSYVDFHRDAVQEKDTRAEADLMINWLRLPPNAHILDLGCGEGRHALEFSRRGFQVTGLDVTLPLLEVARQEASKQNLTVNFFQQDMRDIPWKSSFDAAYCVWGSFGLFDDAGNRQLVQAVHEALKPGGRFLVENHTIETLLPRFWHKGWQHIGDNLIRLEHRQFDHVTSRLESSWLFVHLPTATTETQHMSMRLYTYRELCELLREVGFVGFEGYDTKTGKTFAFGAERLSLIAAKPSHDQRRTV